MLSKSVYVRNFLGIILFCFLSLFSCCKNKEKIVIHTTEEEIDGLKYSIQIPEYTEYPELSEIVKKAVQKDFDSYKVYAVKEWEAAPIDPFTYRTVAEDLSNKKYVNVFIRKYIYCGKNLEDEYYLTFCWDKKRKKRLSIYEATDMSELELSEYCRSSIKKQLEPIVGKDKAYVFDGIDSYLKEDYKLYSNFVLTDDTVTIYFGNGSVTTKGLGAQTVVIKRNGL